jgi:uncharacterized protein (TIGR02266 family)
VLVCLRRALQELTSALDALHERVPGAHPLDAPALLVAQALAVLYPRVRLSERQRHGLVLVDAGTSDEAREPAATAERLDAARLAGPVRGEGLPEQRTAGQRVTIEVDVGVLSESNFYAGVAADVSAGGVFVSTPEPLPEGTEVALYFALDAGRTLHAEGAVRWTRARTDDLPAGMGVAFTQLNDEDRRAIADFCGNRPPWFHP